MQAILEGIDATHANARPIPGCPFGLGNLVLHWTAWKNETARRLAGAVACMPIEGDWPEVGDPNDKRWHEALARLESAHVNLIAAVKALPENKLYEPTNDTRSAPLGTGVSYDALLHGIVQHARGPRRPDCDSEEGALVSSEGLRPSDSPTPGIARRFAGALRSRGSLALLARS